MASSNRSNSVLPKNSRSRSMPRLPPHVAAAMLSLRWTPPEAVRADIEKKSEQRKKCSPSDRNNNNDQCDEPREYEPVLTPEFHEVQTGWPGFVHEPVPNWEEKYMTAKPYPRSHTDVSSKSSYINYGNEKSSIVPTDCLQKDSKSKGNVGGTTQSSENETILGKPRRKRIIHVERSGSCIK